MRRFTSNLFAILPLLLAQSLCHGQLKLDRIYPATVATGSSVEVSLEGKFPTWPAEIYCDRSDVKIEVLPKNESRKTEKIRISVPEKVPQGICWLRVFDADSASKLRPVMIENQLVKVESEPNDASSRLQEITVPSTISGRLSKSEDVDCFGFNAKASQSYVATLFAHRPFRSPMDAVLQLCDQDGNVLAQSDDERGLDPQLHFQFKKDTQVFLRVFAFPETPNSTIGFSGGSDFIYALRITENAISDHFLPLISSRGENQPRVWSYSADTKQPSSNELSGQNSGIGLTEASIQTATKISPPIAYSLDGLGWQLLKPTTTTTSTTWLCEEQISEQDTLNLPAHVSGHLSQPGESDEFVFALRKGKTYRFQVHSRNFGFHLDSKLQLLEPDTGKVLATNDDIERRKYDAKLDYKAKSDGQVKLQIADVADSGGPRHAYTISAESVSPSVDLTLLTDRYQIAPGEEASIPIAIKRNDGFSEELSFKATGLPDSISLEPAKSEPKGSSSKTLTLKLKASPKATPRQIWFQIIAERPHQDSAPIPALYQLRATTLVQNLWLTIKPAKSKSK